MLALLRLRAPRLAFVIAAAAPVLLSRLPPQWQVEQRTALGFVSGGREANIKKDCTGPTICRACGAKGHERKHCPNPDPARLEAFKNASIKWCGLPRKNYTLWTLKQIL
ncbi:hypothetical protein B0H17DRAFT_1150976 [Mycena rosella]|uniref:CCHC-type domain-containing protein n=1 Tax=Mycena rosella TaxID=1033263 RepID=A0AAD7BP34_MYCRO|nr:hypothetical protein B0H17DRAFT_1150976 [Mycena rosella]